MAGDCFCEKMTLSTDLEHGAISDMAAVLWQAAAATTPVRSGGQKAATKAEAQSMVVIRSTTVDTDNFTGLSSVCGICMKSSTEVIFFH